MKINLFGLVWACMGWFGFVFKKDVLGIPPSSFDALLKMPDDIKIVIQDPRTSTPGLGLLLWIKSVYGEDAADYWRSLQPKILTVTKGLSEAYALFLDGECESRAESAPGGLSDRRAAGGGGCL